MNHLSIHLLCEQRRSSTAPKDGQTVPFYFVFFYSAALELWLAHPCSLECRTQDGSTSFYSPYEILAHSIVHFVGSEVKEEWCGGAVSVYGL